MGGAGQGWYILSDGGRVLSVPAEELAGAEAPGAAAGSLHADQRSMAIGSR